MTNRLALVLCASLTLCISVPAAASQEGARPPATGEGEAAEPANNPEVQAMFDADQAARRGPQPINWDTVSQEDAERRARVARLLAEGALRTGLDHYHAAYIYQHGTEPEDFLKAHSLAMTALALDYVEARWIAAATLDRFLQKIGRPQIYGTQYWTPPDQPAHQEPYDRTFVSDAERALLGVPPREQQEERRAEFDRRRGIEPRTGD